MYRSGHENPVPEDKTHKSLEERIPGKAAQQRDVWRDPRLVERLVELWGSGLSTAQIGKILDVSKNAVIGKVHRLGLPARPSPIPKAAQQRQERAARRAGEAARGSKGLQRDPRMASPQPRMFATSQAGMSNTAQTTPRTTGQTGMTAPIKPVPQQRPVLRSAGDPKMRRLSPGCRWPLWNHEERPTHRYCDKPVVPAWPWVYCAECRDRAFMRRRDETETRADDTPRVDPAMSRGLEEAR